MFVHRPDVFGVLTVVIIPPGRQVLVCVVQAFLELEKLFTHGVSGKGLLVPRPRQ